MKILVTGAGGMVGSHMIELLSFEGHEIIGTYYKPTVDLREVKCSAKLIECDVRYQKNIEKIIFEFQPDKIFHLAAQSYPTVFWDKPYETIDPKLIRPTDEKVIVGGISKLKKDTNWSQKIDIKTTIKNMLNYWRERLDAKY